MLTFYALDDRRLLEKGEALAADAVWIDMFNPTREEEKKVEELCGIGIPTAEEMQEIEISSRLYNEDDATFMTAWVLAHTPQEHVSVSPMTFILAGTRLITLRTHEPRFFTAFVGRCQKTPAAGATADSLLVALLEACVDRLADIIEKAAHDVDNLSREIFVQSTSKRPQSLDYRDKLVRLGQKGDLVSDIRESLTSLERLIGYLGLVATERRLDKELKARIKTLARDNHSLVDHLAFVSQKITFLLDATLGLINIEQNQIIKIFSVAAVVFLPPTLIASIYGMNFEFMPETASRFGYPLALVGMVLSAILPYLFFKRKGWL